MLIVTIYLTFVGTEAETDVTCGHTSHGVWFHFVVV